MTAELFGLLTRIRMPGATFDLQKAARQQQFFPLVGIVVGLIAAVVALVLNELFGKDLAAVSGGLVLVVLYSVTGILHTEGLADLADGIMAHGTRERKREVMKDVHSGVAAVFGVVLYLLLFFAAATETCEDADKAVSAPLLPWEGVVALGFVLSEISGKLAINVSMYMGPSAHEGMGAIFVREATPGRLVVALGIGAVAAFLVAGTLSVLILAGIIAGVAVTLLARKDLGGVSGNVFGAANEVGRLATLIAWVLIV